jgi:hypothetical protein
MMVAFSGTCNSSNRKHIRNPIPSYSHRRFRLPPFFLSRDFWDSQQLWPLISYNYSYKWDYTFYKWGDLLVLITGISGHNCKLSRTIFGATYATADLLPASQSPTDAISMRSRLHATSEVADATNQRGRRLPHIHQANHRWMAYGPIFWLNSTCFFKLQGKSIFL